MSKRKDLRSFVENITGNDIFKIDEDLGNGYVRLKVSEAEKRQAKHDIRYIEDILIELLRNARDAMAEKIFVASHRDEKIREITVIDDGCGIPSSLHDKIFQPRVTSKLNDLVTDKYGIHGRGMALFSVKTASQDAKVIFSQENCGTAIQVKVSLDELPERKNQSTLPQIVFHNKKPIIKSGHYNFWRVLIEFWIENPEIQIFFGSPAEIFSTMFYLNKLTNRRNKKIWSFAQDYGQASLTAQKAKVFFGFDLSERTIYRILKREISVLPSLSEIIESLHHQKRKRKLTQKKISSQDLEEFSQQVKDLSVKLAEKYFLVPTDLRIRHRNSQISIIISLEETEKI